MSDTHDPQSDPRDVTLYGKASAAVYLGVSEVWIEKLVKRKALRSWQEIPPERLPNGKLTRGSALVFEQHWLDDYKAAPKRKPGRPPNRGDEDL